MKYHLQILVVIVTSVFMSMSGFCEDEIFLWTEEGNEVIQDEVYVPETHKAVLISRGKETSQTSTGWDGYASYGNDGNTNQNYHAKTCTHTQLERNPWWKIDFGSRYFIERVRVFNREDCCGFRLTTLKVQVSDNNVDWTEVGALNGQARNGRVYTIPARGQGRYLRLIIGKPESEYLTLCEVEIYGNQLAAPLISRGKFASQSSVSHDGAARLAIDGNYIQNYHHKTCTHTNNELNPWWKIDLENYYQLHSVKIWNRVDCCSERLNSLIVQASQDDINWYHIGSLNEAPNSGRALTIPLRSRWEYRYVRLTLSSETEGVLTLCEVEIYGTRRRPALISRGKHASQSSVSHEAFPFLGNDGLYNQSFTAKTCTHTISEKNPWWKIDLGSLYTIESVRVWNRGDCCGGRLNSLVAHVSSDNSNWNRVGLLQEEVKDGGVYTIPAKGTGRYVRLMLGKDSHDILTLCEVEVYGRPITGENKSG